MLIHAKFGADIIKGFLAELEDKDYLIIARDMAHYHHAKWDSSGYPKGLKGGEISLCIRIMAIADVHDVLHSRRSCKKEFLLERARIVIEESVGTHFDPEGVEVFLENIWAIEAAKQGTY